MVTFVPGASLLKSIQVAGYDDSGVRRPDELPPLEFQHTRFAPEQSFGDYPRDVIKVAAGEAVTTGFQAHHYGARELLLESTHLLFVVVLQFRNDEFASFSFQITDRLLSCMKVNADIYCIHSAQSLSQQLFRSTASAIATKIFRVPEYGARPCAVSMLSSSITSPARYGKETVCCL